MEDFNRPGQNKFKIDDNSKKYAAEWQLSNVAKLLDADIEHCRVTYSDNRKDIYNKITIIYKENSCNQ